MDMVRSRAAASSIASGIPSSARQTRAIVASVLASTARSLRTALARSRSSWTAGEDSISPGPASPSGRASGSTAHSASPVMPSGSLLVARMRSRWHSPSTRCANTAADSITCSQLSRISSASRSRIAAMSRSVGSAFGASPSRASRRPSALSVDCATSPSAPMAARSTSQAPSGRSPSSVRAVSVASLVFPEPPGPIRVVSRRVAMSSRTAATSASLPTKAVSSARRLVFRVSSRRPSSPRSSATCNAASSGEGSTPSASARASRARWYTSSASLSRPAATRARISAAASRSRNGCAATRSVSSVTSSAPCPRVISASARSSAAVSRNSSSRMTAASNAALSSRPTSCMAAPRHSSRASRSSRARREASPVRAWPAMTRRSNRTASTASGSTRSR